MLSDADPPSVTVDVQIEYVEKDVGVEIVAVGGVVSVGVVGVVGVVGLLEPLLYTLIESVPVLPAASCAVIVMMFAPLWRAIPALQFVVPLATPLPPRSFDHLTCVTPTLSVAVPPSVTVDDHVE